MSCVCHAFASVHCCLVVTCWERADLLAFVCDVCVFVNFPCCIPGQVWYLIVSIPDFCCPSYFYKPLHRSTSFCWTFPKLLAKFLISSDTIELEAIHSNVFIPSRVKEQSRYSWMGPVLHMGTLSLCTTGYSLSPHYYFWHQ